MARRAGVGAATLFRRFPDKAVIPAGRAGRALRRAGAARHPGGRPRPRSRIGTGPGAGDCSGVGGRRLQRAGRRPGRRRADPGDRRGVLRRPRHPPGTRSGRGRAPARTVSPSADR
ncbi:TetR/AcrR family transcriptional regulator [Kitasatospora aureofaciens]|uniref:TetR/AcrR family transcriptional regulator n=1 Tax=Kitasatospora aureofaciens TaxID=1894 RepID=UPI000AD38270